MNTRTHGTRVTLILIALVSIMASTPAHAEAPDTCAAATAAEPAALARAVDDPEQLEALAREGDAQAAWLLARTLVRAAPRDEAVRVRAGHWLVCAADAGFATAAQRLATDPALIPPGETRTADDFLLTAARAGLPGAQWRLGERLTLDREDRRDYGLARFWLTLAADGGDSRAQFTLAWLHERGLGGAADAAAAERRYRQAASGGDERARNNLAWLLARGWNCPSPWIRTRQVLSTISATCASPARTRPAPAAPGAGP
jgi:TPR repeat protein